VRENQTITNAMFAIIYLLRTFIADLLKSRRRLEVENQRAAEDAHQG
jgi:hypothetical protein